MPVISVKHENNKPGDACFHIGERRDKRWSCRSSSGGENPVQFSIDEDAATTPRDGDRRQLGARRGHKTMTDCGFIVPTPNAASPFRQPRRLCRLLPPCALDGSTAGLNETRSGSRAQLGRKWWPQFRVSCSNCLSQRSFVPVA